MRIVAIVVALAATGVVGWLGVKANRNFAERRQATQVRATLPSVELVDVNGMPAGISAAPGRSTVLLFFTTTCEYCRAELAEMKREAASFDGSNVVLVSPENRETVRAFREKSGLDLFPQFRMLCDTIPTLGARFRIRRVPTVLVYGSAGRLTAEFEGFTQIERILHAAEALQ